MDTFLRILIVIAGLFFAGMSALRVPEGFGHWFDSPLIHLPELSWRRTRAGRLASLLYGADTAALLTYAVLAAVEVFGSRPAGVPWAAGAVSAAVLAASGAALIVSRRVGTDQMEKDIEAYWKIRKSGLYREYGDEQRLWDVSRLCNGAVVNTFWIAVGMAICLPVFIWT